VIRLLLTLLIIGAPWFMLGQGDTVLIARYGGSESEVARKIIRCQQGGYALAGTTGSFEVNQTDGFLMKVDDNMECEWTLSMGSIGVDRINDVVQSSDGSFFLCGYTNSTGTEDYDSWVIKVSAAGEVEWQNFSGWVGWDFANALVVTSDEVCVGGYAYSTGGLPQASLWIYSITGAPMDHIVWSLGESSEIRAMAFHDSLGLVLGGVSRFNENTLDNAWLQFLDTGLQSISTIQFANDTADLSINGVDIGYHRSQQRWVAGFTGDWDSYGGDYVLQGQCDSGHIYQWYSRLPSPSGIGMNDVSIVASDTMAMFGWVNYAGGGLKDALCVVFDRNNFLNGVNYGGPEDEVFYSGSYHPADSSLIACGEYGSTSSFISDAFANRWTQLAFGSYEEVTLDHQMCLSLSTEEWNDQPLGDLLQVVLYDTMGRKAQDKSTQVLSPGIYIEVSTFAGGAVSTRKLFVAHLPVQE
jgi:hypothetical protein